MNFFTSVNSRILDGRVLVVDDIKTNIDIMRGMLAPYGLYVDTAASGSQAVELVKNHDYDLVFMDHLMPGMDGVETAAAIKNNLRHLPIIAMTANEMPGMREFFLEHGFDDYLSKPISPQLLDEVIVKWIGKKIKNEELGVRNKNKISNSTIVTAMEEHRLDMLNHYRMSFASGKTDNADEKYFKRFIALIESIDTSDAAPGVQAENFLAGQAAVLIKAGRCGDVQKIRETLPVFYKLLQDLLQKRLEQERDPEGNIQVILQKLKKAILAKETETVEAVMGELGALSLKSFERELYFLLCDFLLTEETERAVGAISLALRLGENCPEISEHKYD